MTPVQPASIVCTNTPSPGPEEGKRGGGVLAMIGVELEDRSLSSEEEESEELVGATELFLLDDACASSEDALLLRRSAISLRRASSARSPRRHASSCGFSDGSRFLSSIAISSGSRPTKAPVPTRSHHVPCQTIDETVLSQC